jgi:hypothetical protein
MKTVSLFLSMLALAAVPAVARAHCDGLDGPVVQAGRVALDSGRIGPVLAWVPARDEAEIRHAFDHARAVRRLGPEAKALADRFFFETLVRVHRAGEGAPYTGLRPAGRDPGPAVTGADRALETGSAAEVEKLLVESVRHGLHERFGRLKALARPGDDVASGRAWVEAYVPWVHWVEGVHAAATAAGHGGDDGSGSRSHPEAGHGH